MKVWEDRAWRLLFAALTLLGIVGLRQLSEATLAVAEAVPLQARPPCEAKPPAKPALEVIEHPQR